MDAIIENLDKTYIHTPISKQINKQTIFPLFVSWSRYVQMKYCLQVWRISVKIYAMKLLLKSNSTYTRYKIFTISYKFPIINRLPHAPILEIKNNRKGKKEIANFGKFAWRVKVSNMYLSIYSTLVCCIRSWIMTFMESSKMQLDISYYIYIYFWKLFESPSESGVLQRIV